VCSLISYRLPDLFSDVVIGIGSLATTPSERRKGYATTALNMLVEGYKSQYQVETFVLFTDIGPSIYETCDFCSVQPHSNDSQLMVKSNRYDYNQIKKHLNQHAIAYF
jgi:hypothetical protein